MKQKRHTSEEIIKKLREAEALIAAGKGIDGTVRGIGVSAATYQRWKTRYGGMRQDTLKRLREMEKENARLKRAVADLTLREEILRLSAKEKRAGCRTVWRHLRQEGWEVNHKRVIGFGRRRDCGCCSKATSADALAA